MTLRLTQPVIEMISRGGKYRRGQKQLMHGADNLATFVCQLSENPESLNLLELLGPI
jgi:hypothetical protein